MLTRRRKKSQQNSYMPQMLTRRRKKSQQNSYILKMLTRRRKKSQQNSYMPKMLTSQQKIILYCKYGDADAGGWYTERSASQNGMLLTDHFEAVFVKNNSRQGMNFLRKFNHFMRFRAFRSDIWSPARIYDTARRSHTEIAHFTQLKLQCKMRQRSLSSRRRKAA